VSKRVIPSIIVLSELNIYSLDVVRRIWISCHGKPGYRHFVMTIVLSERLSAVAPFVGDLYILTMRRFDRPPFKAIRCLFRIRRFHSPGFKKSRCLLTISLFHSRGFQRSLPTIARFDPLWLKEIRLTLNKTWE
jgi:hypothetical protein